MLNKQDFFSEVGMILKYRTELSWDDVGIYLDILDQDSKIIDCILNSYKSNKGEKEYIAPSNDGWNATNGKIRIHEYIIEFCCYGDFAINVYKDDEFLAMLTSNPKINVFTRIEEITQEIRDLKEERENLLDDIRQMA